MYRIPEEQKPEKFTETQEDKKLLERIDDFDKKMLSYLGRLYQGMTGEKMDFDTIKSSIDALQQYNSASEYKYLDNLLHPEKHKGIKIPSPIPVPSCSFQLHNSVTLSTNNMGNLAIVFNPFFLYNSGGLQKIPISGDAPVYNSVTPSWLSSFYVNNSENLDGHTPTANDSDWLPVNIGQGIPNVYDQYRLVSGSIVVKYIGRLDSVSGIIGGAIVFDEEKQVGYYGQINNDSSSSSTLTHSTGPWLKKYANFDLAMDAFYHQENLCLEGVRELYFPIDNTFEEYMKLLRSNYMSAVYRGSDIYGFHLEADQDYYKSGFNQMIYILGAPASQACFKVDIYLNFECLPNSEFLNYMPITPNNVCIDPYYKKQAIAETQRRSVTKANSDEGLPPAPPSIWERMKQKFGNALPGIAKLIANGLLNAVPMLRSGLGLAGSMIGDALMNSYNK